jgi:hypothetical protein
MAPSKKFENPSANMRFPIVAKSGENFGAMYKMFGFV